MKDFDAMPVNSTELREALRIRKANEKAYDLLLSFSDVVNFGLVDDATTMDLPNGDASLAWANLVNKHGPKPTSNKVQLKLEFNSSRLSDVKKDPEVWISGLEVIRQKLKNMNYIISDEDLIIHIINNLPRDYEAMTDQLEIELDNEENEIGIADVKARLQNKYNNLKKYLKVKSDKSEENEGEETALSAGKMKFKGQCLHCGKWGHKSVDCRDKISNGNKFGKSGDQKSGSKFDGECFYCKKKGHRATDCFKKKMMKTETMMRVQMQQQAKR